MSVMIVTSLGELVLDLFTDRCPLTCKNFLKLCKIKYYNGCLFHTVTKDFIAQTGDPTGTGEGGDSLYKLLYGDQARFFNDEIHLDLKHSKTGTLAMANLGENLNASQFYITLRDDIEYRDGKNTVFGEVAEGFDTLTRINEAYADENGKPYKNIRIKHTYILDDPFEDPPQLASLIPDASPEGKPKDEIVDEVRLEDDWVPLDEQISHQELEEVIREKVAHSSAVVLESIGDIPDAEMKPPDNVLFVCKLNPVTEDEDLNTIFSRFGAVTSADVIRDFKTGDSLCYAFIEYEDKDACEEAYFKMDNALIDDRRIHVDFSQSVAKLWSQYRRKGQKGGGCFKCGAIDHIAKDCTGEPITGQQNTKYVLKDNNTQRGGKNNSRYEMVFAEDGHGSPRQSKRRRNSEDDRDDRKRVPHDIISKDRDDRRRDPPPPPPPPRDISDKRRDPPPRERSNDRDDRRRDPPPRERSNDRYDRRRDAPRDISERRKDPPRDVSERKRDPPRDISIDRDDRRRDPPPPRDMSKRRDLPPRDISKDRDDRRRDPPRDISDRSRDSSRDISDKRRDPPRDISSKDRDDRKRDPRERSSKEHEKRREDEREREKGRR